MKSSQVVTLFTQEADFGQRPTSFIASVLLHIIVLSVVLFGIAYRPPYTKLKTDHYALRELELHLPDEQVRSAMSRAVSAGSHSSAKSQASSGKSLAQQLAQLQTAQAAPGPQTLIQPDVLNPIKLSEKIPIPQVVIWSPSKVQVKTIVPPAPEKPTAANIKPSVERPNQEMNLADVNISSSFHPSAKSIVPPSTTSPIAVPVPQQIQLPPVTASQSAAAPTPAAIVSLSDLHMKDGKAALPPVNQTAASNSNSGLSPGVVKDQSQPGTSAAKPGDSGSGQGVAANSSNPGASAGQGSANKGNNAGSGSGPSAEGKGNGSGPAVAAGQGPDENGQLTTTVITVSKDGHFGSVVVGNSLEDKFPELAEVWNGRVVYTVYLHVGLSRSWILQYALPHAPDAGAAGTVVHLDAPWPYNIVRPNLDPGSVDADAIMIHGFINPSGRFETLSIVVPQAFSKAQFVLAALQQWQFRPALQDGQNAKVEVLLIIPEYLE
jgi:hypothetical protein